jgi:hypothetical protein
MHVQIPTESAWRGAPRYIVTGVWTPCAPAIAAGTPTRGMLPGNTGGGCKCRCNDSDGLGSLGQTNPTLTAAQAMQEAIAQGQSAGLKLNPTAFQNATWMAKAESQIQAGAFDIGWYSPSCGSNPTPNMNLLAVGGGIALSAGGAATGIMVATNVISAATGAIVGAATLGIGALISVISLIFQHHAAAVQRDLSFGCGALPAVNNAFAVINQAVHSGQTTPAAAAQALDQINTEYQSAGQGGAINNSPWCNSNCEMGVVLKGMVLYWQSQYQAMAAAAAPAPASSSTPAVAASAAAPTPAPAPGTSYVSTSTAPPAAGASQPSGTIVAVPPSSGLSTGWLLALLGLGAAWAFL